MDLGIAGKAALVCASTSGLGAATGEALAAEGCRVVFADAEQNWPSRSPPIPACRDEHRRSCLSLHAAAVQAVGPLEIIVLNSPPPPGATADGIDPQALNASLESLLLAPTAIVAAALPHLRAQHWGRILAIGSSGIKPPFTVEQADAALSSERRLRPTGRQRCSRLSRPTLPSA